MAGAFSSIARHRNLATYDFFLYDLVRGVEQRLTTDRLSESGGVWLPGGQTAMFTGGAPPHLFRRNLNDRRAGGNPAAAGFLA